MRAVAALVRARWRTAKSYRLDFAFSLGGLLFSVIPTYFVAQALQPTMEASIQGEGDHYFPFVIVGMVALSLLSTAVNRLPNAIDESVRTGTLEALFSTSAGFPSILTGLTGYGFVWSAVKGALLLVAAWVLGAEFVAARIPAGMLILALVVAAHVPLGLIGGAAMLAFRTTGPFPQIVLASSGLLGGVYYPTHVIPSWIEHLSAALPLTYGLRALRRVWLEGETLGQVAGDVGILLLFVGGLGVVGWTAFRAALRYARRNGTLSQY